MPCKYSYGPNISDVVNSRQFIYEKPFNQPV